MVVHTYNLRRLRKKDHKFTASLGSLAITCFKIKKKKGRGQGAQDVSQCLPSMHEVLGSVASTEF
jgi:hypothetical protein